MSHEIELCGCLTIPEDANWDEVAAGTEKRNDCLRPETQGEVGLCIMP